MISPSFLLVLCFVCSVNAQNWTQIVRDIVCTLPPTQNRDSYANFLGGYLRLAFHDAAGGGGRPNGCFDTNEAANKGLNEFSNALEPLATKYRASGVSRGDIWALAGSVAVYISGGPKIPYFKGRKDCDFDAFPGTPSDVKLLPLPTDTYARVIAIMHTRMKLTFQEITALMGSHTLGRANPQKSGFSGPQVPNNDQFTNRWYQDSLQRPWNKDLQKFGADHPVWLNNGFIRFNTDIQLMVNTANCQHLQPGVRNATCPTNTQTAPFMQLYANNQTRWFTDFTAAYVKLTKTGYGNTLKKVAIAWPSRPTLRSLACNGGPPPPPPPPQNPPPPPPP